MVTAIHGWVTNVISISVFDFILHRPWSGAEIKIPAANDLIEGIRVRVRILQATLFDNISLVN